MVEEAYKQPRNDEAIIKLVGRLTLKFATMEISHGVKLEYIQKLLGHESPETTLRYAQISDNNLKHIYEASM